MTGLALSVFLLLVCVVTAARADAVPGMPNDVPAAATTPPPTLSEPSSTAWPFPSGFPETSGTGRLDGGASLWTDFIYDDYGASQPGELPASGYQASSSLSPRHGSYVYPSGAADNNGADIFRAGVGLKGGYSYWRVDWLTLADPSIPIAEWTFDTDNNPATGGSAWPAEAGVSSAGIDNALVVSSRGAWLINPVTGIRTNVLADGGKLTVDPAAKSFVVAIPNSVLPVSGTWRIRLGAGLADSTGQNFAPPDIGTAGGATLPSLTAERLYNITFRSVAQEPPIYSDGDTAALTAAAETGLGATPVGQSLGADGIARTVTGNFWMENDQSDTLAGGDVSKFSELITWSALAGTQTTPDPQPTGYSTRWYVSRLDPGAGQLTNDGPEGNLKPTLLERVQPYSVYVPTTYQSGSPSSLTWILHSLEVNYNQYGALDPSLIQELCQDRNSICATTEGFGPAGWYYNEAETDFWQVWRELAGAYSLNVDRTVVSGYSMGGWASYKLAFEHPDDFAGALVMDGPVVCGVEAYPGVSGAAGSGDPGCSQDGQSAPLIANAKWIPYVIDQTSGDELVPTSGVLAQAQAFDSLGQRYNLFIHTGGDHLAFATEDRFGDAVTALGSPTRTADPGQFTYDWYPSVDNATLGIGATGDYWISGLSARDNAYGKIASIQADDAALPDPSVTVQRSGTKLVTQPLPGTETQLSWKLGAPPAAKPDMSLKLGDVSALAVDTAAANLPLGTITVTSDGPARLTLNALPYRTVVVVNGAKAGVVGVSGSFTVNVGTGRTVIGLAIAYSKPANHSSCAAPTGRLSARALGPSRLDATRAAVRRKFARSARSTHGNLDRFCSGLQAGYPSKTLLRSLSRKLRRRVSGRAVLLVTSNRHYSLHGIKPGTRLAKVRRKLHGAAIHVGRNFFYVVANGSSRGLLVVRRGVIRDIGIADRRLLTSRTRIRRFLRSFALR